MFVSSERRGALEIGPREEGRLYVKQFTPVTGMIALMDWAWEAKEHSVLREIPIIGFAVCEMWEDVGSRAEYSTQILPVQASTDGMDMLPLIGYDTSNFYGVFQKSDREAIEAAREEWGKRVARYTKPQTNNP